MSDQFGDHRIIVRCDAVALAETRVDAHVVRKLQMRQHSGLRLEVPRWIFGIEPGLDGMTTNRQIALPDWQWFAIGNAELPLDQIETCYQLRDRMFDLQPGIHLHEIEAVGSQAIGDIGDELHGSRTSVTHGLCGIHGGLAHGLAHLRRHARGRGFLDHFLMAALQRAVALKQMNDIALIVGEHLNFNMAGRGHESLKENAVVTERLKRLPAGHWRVRCRTQPDHRPGACPFRHPRQPA